MPVTLQRLPQSYAIAQLEPAAAVPAWCEGEGFVCISRTDDELTVVCAQGRVPPAVRRDGDWCAYRIAGPFAFDETGVLLSVIEPVSEQGLGVFVVSTFNGDVLLVKQADRAAAERHLTAAGHTLR